MGRLDQAGPLSFEGQAGSSHSPPLLGGPGYGRDPVGKGQAAAGFSAGRALVAADGAATGLAVVSAGLTVGLAAFIAFFFFPAFFFFLAGFFAAAFFLPAFFNFFFFGDDQLACSLAASKTLFFTLDLINFGPLSIQVALSSQ